MYKKLLSISKKFDIDKAKDTKFLKTHTPFVGTPQKHPSDKNILILITSTFSTEKKFYEFSLETIGNVDDLGTITSETGESTRQIRIWVQKGSHALIAESFTVE